LNLAHQRSQPGEWRKTRGDMDFMLVDENSKRQ
jgi:hypothetical protein